MDTRTVNHLGMIEAAASMAPIQERPLSHTDENWQALPQRLRGRGVLRARRGDHGEYVMACEWAQEDEDSDVWWTTCGEGFCLIDGGPTHHRMLYCCFCSEEIKEVPYVRPEDEDE